MSKYVEIQTAVKKYKCHQYLDKNGVISFNGRQVPKENVATITDHRGIVIYSNAKIVVLKPPRVVPHHYSSLRGATRCKATQK